MEKSQNHHYIPRFILRNFAQQPSPQPRKPGGTRQQKRRRRLRPTSQDEYISIVDLREERPKLEERPVAVTFAERDLYRDLNRKNNQHRLEEQLSVLEARAGKTISNIRKAYETGLGSISLGRVEKDELQKFLFIMKYRGPSQYRRYAHESIDTYTADDKASLKSYMELKGFQKPIDVWFANIQAMLNAELDANSICSKDPIADMYPMDARWYIIHLKLMFLAICTPSSKDDEFLLSANTFSVHEGPTDSEFDPETCEEIGKAYTEYHILNVIHPHIALILRSVLLPCAEEDLAPEVKASREIWSYLCRGQHLDPARANSILFDLPVTKATNSYAMPTSHGLVLVPGHDGRLRQTDTFTFEYFPLSHAHVGKINAIILENVERGPLIAYKTMDALKSTLETYLTMESAVEDIFTDGGFKHVRLGTKRHEYLQKLVLLSKQLGLTKEAVYHVYPSSYEENIIDALEESGENNVPDAPTGFMLCYPKLGGTLRQFPNDLDQASRILQWRIRLDIYIARLGEELQSQIREVLRKLIIELPAARVWLYTKSERYFEISNGGLDGALELERIVDGPEDTIARLKDIFRPEMVCRMIHLSAAYHTTRMKDPETLVLLYPAGCIAECGIPAVEAAAKSYMSDRIPHAIVNEALPPVRPGNMHSQLEITLRGLIRRNLANILQASKLRQEDLIELNSRFFGLLYISPTPVGATAGRWDEILDANCRLLAAK